MSNLKANNIITSIDTHNNHTVRQPIEEFVLSGRPLSVYSEKAVEMQHHYYESHKARLLVNPLYHELSKEQLLKSIISYNSIIYYNYYLLFN